MKMPKEGFEPSTYALGVRRSIQAELLGLDLFSVFAEAYGIAMRVLGFEPR